MSQDFPLFSIIVPTHNRADQLTNICLPALAGLDYPRRNFEVIIVDDGGKVPLDGAVEKFAESLNIKLIKQAHSGPAIARNQGAASAEGRFIAFTDDDCAPTTAWLKALAERFGASRGCAIGGRTCNALVHNPYSVAHQVLIDYLYKRFNADSNRMRFFTSNNLAMPAGPFRAIGGFNEVFSMGGEDRELCYRWTYLGFRLIYAPEAQVNHLHHMSLRGFLRQHFKYGIGAFRFRKTVAELDNEPKQIESPAFYLGLLRYALLQAHSQSAICLGLLIIFSQLATSLGYVSEIWKLASKRVNASVEKAT